MGSTYSYYTGSAVASPAGVTTAATAGALATTPATTTAITPAATSTTSSNYSPDNVAVDSLDNLIKDVRKDAPKEVTATSINPRYAVVEDVREDSRVPYRADENHRAIVEDVKRQIRGPDEQPRRYNLTNVSGVQNVERANGILDDELALKIALEESAKDVVAKDVVAKDVVAKDNNNKK